MLSIKPDPAHPRGGYAVISIDESAMADDTVTLTIRNSFNERYLGEDGWQAGKAYFGPYPVVVDGGRAAFVVGTEIVNLIEEYTPIAIGLGSVEHETSWPDDIMQGPAAATVGGVSPTSPLQDTSSGPTLVGKSRNPGPKDLKLSNVDDTGLVTDPAPPEPVPSEPLEAGVETAKSKSALVWPIILLLIAAIAGGAYWFLTQNEPVASTPPEPVVVPEPVQPEPAPEDQCSPAALGSKAGEGYGALLEQLSSCGTAVTADTALGLLEKGVAAEDPAALHALGRMYDQDLVIEVIETDIGLTFGDNPARAVEYYARARDAGDGVGAAEALVQVCERLATSSDTLSQGAFEDFCR